MSDISEARKIIKGFASTIGNIKLNTLVFQLVVKKIAHCTGKVVTTGMGKAGIAMEKFSSTLCSLGVPSCFLHPGTASHGDLGVLSPDDILFVASTSGKTREVLETVESATNIGVSSIIGITSHSDSPLRDVVNHTLDMGVIKEEGHLGLAPTSSILVMLAITDALALVVAKKKGLTAEGYFQYHHSGYLGETAAEMSSGKKYTNRPRK